MNESCKLKVVFFLFFGVVISIALQAAIAVRYHIAQVCALENIDFNIGNGRGVVEEMGNIIENCTFRGGQYGIKTNFSPPDWQCMVLDCSFKGQREASMITNSLYSPQAARNGGSI